MLAFGSCVFANLVLMLYWIYWYSVLWEATNFNQNIRDWDVSSVMSGEKMLGRTSFNQDLNEWDTSAMTILTGAFHTVSDLGCVFALVHIVLAHVSHVARGGTTQASAFNGNISNWDVSRVVEMSGVFNGSPFNQNISNWDVSQVTIFSSMFFAAESFNQNIAQWDISKGTNMRTMFSQASNFRQNLCPWRDKDSNVQNNINMFLNSNCANTNSPGASGPYCFGC